MNETIRAAWVIARRDFTAIIFSKSFFFFLLGPLFPLLVGLAAGGLGSEVAKDIASPTIAINMGDAALAPISKANKQLIKKLGENRLPTLYFVPPSSDGQLNAAEILANKKNGVIAVLSGDLDNPQFTGTKREVDRWQGEMELLLSIAKSGDSLLPVDVKRSYVKGSEGSRKRSRLGTAQASQVLLFLLTMLLAGMVLSNLVEEKTNKIIEILAAAIPIDSIFLGKLFAMLGMAFVGISVWIAVGFAGASLFGGGLPNFPAPAVGWPVFGLLAILYFTMAYLLLGSLFLGIGAMAATVREVQTLSMPVTMGQMVVFFLASYSVTKLGQPIELFAVIFPFSSPFAMLARAAQMESLGQHILALIWQATFVWIVIRTGASLFRRNVMKSGSAGKKEKKPNLFSRLFGRKSSAS